MNLVYLETQTYPFWSGHRLHIDWWGAPSTIAMLTRSRRIVWNPAETSIVASRLHGVISVPMGSTGQIYMNNEITHFADGRLFGASVDAEVDVLLRNGENYVKIEMTKFAGLDMIGTFSAELIIEFSGVAPIVEETKDEEPFDWRQVALWGVGLGILAGGGYILLRGMDVIGKSGMLNPKNWW